MPEPDPLELEVFRTGDYGPKGIYQEEDLERIATSYDPSRHEAPVTLDHAIDGPAHGWVTRLRRLGDRLLATVTRLSPALAESLRSGAYRKRSVELYRAHPQTGAPYLRAVSFLGAAVPEVKGLTDPVFAEQSDVLTFDEAGNAATAEERAVVVHAMAEQLRDQLLRERRWLPAWDEAGLREVFAALAGTPQFTALEQVLRGMPAVGAVPLRHSESATTHDHFHGEASPTSRARHERALQFLDQHPGASYREALAAANH